MSPPPAVPVTVLAPESASRTATAVRAGATATGPLSVVVPPTAVGADDPAPVVVPAGDVDVAVELRGRMAVITLAGTLDAASSHEVSLALDPLLDAGLALVVVDVAQAEFADTSGLGVLLRAQRLIGGGRSLVLRTPGPSLVRLLQLTGLGDEFELA